MAVHEGQKATDVGEALPFVAGHLSDQRGFAVDDFVVRNRQYEALAEGVHDRKRQALMQAFAEDRIELEVVKHVVHPAHVPLHGKAQTTGVSGVRDAGKRRGLFGDSQDARLAMAGFVEAAQKGDGVQVFVAAVLVGQPLAFLLTEIQVQHAGHGVHSIAIQVKSLQPMDGARQQKALHLRPAIVEDQRAPFLMLALAGIGVLVKEAAIEVVQPMQVAREVSGHPIENDAQAGLMALVDEVTEVIGRAVARGGREHAGDLIAPGAGERMFRDGQQFEMGVVHLDRVGNQLGRQLAIVQLATFLAGDAMAQPGPQMDLVHRHRRSVPVGGRPPIDPGIVAPFEAIRRGHDGAGGGRQLRRKSVRVGL